MKKSHLFILVFLTLFFVDVQANNQGFTVKDIKAVIPTTNIQLCKAQGNMVNSLKLSLENQKVIREKLESATGEEKEKLEETLTTLENSYETISKLVLRFKNTEFAGANLILPKGSNLSEEIPTGNGSLRVWQSDPTSQITFLGPDICGYLDLKQDKATLTAENIVSFLNSLNLFATTD